MYIAFKKYTREEFLEEHVRSNCPSDFGLEDIDYNTCSGEDIEQCQECWNEATKDVDFKNDIITFKEQAVNVLNSLAAVESEYKQISNNRDNLKKSLLQMMEDYGIDKFENDKLSITYVKEGKTTTFDSKKFKVDYPEIYQHYIKESNSFEKVTGLKVRRLGFLFVPKFNGRMKNDEDLYMFRKRLIKEVDKLEIKLVEIKYDPNKIISFQRKIIKVLETNTYEKNVTRLCDWCDYKNYCIKGEDYMILPKNERRERKIDTNPDLWIYADSYVGKSTFIDQFNDLLFLNTDGNTDNTTSPVIRIADEVKVEGRITKRKFAWDVFLETISELEKKQNDFKRVCIDLVEDVYEHCRLYTYDKLGIQHEQDAGFGKGWDMVRTEYLSAIKRLKNLGYQIIYISKETISEINLKNGAKLTTIKPNINDKVANILAGTVDLTVRAYVKDEERFLQLEKKENIFGGGRFDFKVNEIPLNKEEFIKALEEAQEGIKTYSKVESSEEVKEEPKKSKKEKVVKESEVVENTEDTESEEAEEEQPKKSRKRKKKSDPVEDLMLHEIEGK